MSNGRRHIKLTALSNFFFTSQGDFQILFSETGFAEAIKRRIARIVSGRIEKPIVNFLTVKGYNSNLNSLNICFLFRLLVFTA